MNDSRGSEDLEAAMIFAEVRPRLFGIAYRMLGSSTEAEDHLLDEATARDELVSAAGRIGLPRGEAERTITSGLTAGACQPRNLPS